MNALPAPITKEAFDAWLLHADITELLTDKSFAMVHHLPEEHGDELNERLNDLRTFAHAENLTDGMFNDWYDRYHREYVRNPEKFIMKALAGAGSGGYPLPDSLDDIEPQETSWLIPGALPRNEVALLGAQGGSGKGLAVAQLAASVTTGSPCPLFGGAAPDRPGNVVIFSGEDDPAKVLKPRLMAAGADTSRITIITSTWFYSKTGQQLTLESNAFKSYTSPLQSLSEAKPAPALIIVDPLQSFLPSKVDMISRNEMRKALIPFAAICAENHAAGMIVMHTNKRSDASGRNRLADSADMWDLARAVFMMGADPQQKGIVYLSNEKNNYAVKMQTALFEIVDTFVTDSAGKEIKTAAAVFREYTDKRDADFQQLRRYRQPATKLAVQNAILDRLNDAPTGCIGSTRLRLAVMEETGCSEHTYKRAASEMKKSGLAFPFKIHDKNGTDAWYISRYSSLAKPSNTFTENR